MYYKNKKLHILIHIIIFGMLIFLLYSFLIKRYFFADSPEGDFLFIVDDYLMDFFNVNSMVSNLNPYIEGGSSYPPFILMIAYIFSCFLPYNTMTAVDIRHMYWGKLSYFVIFLPLSLLLFVIIFINIHPKKGATKNHIIDTFETIIATSALLFTAPFLYLIDRGNYLIISLIFMLLSFITYHSKPTLSAIFLAFASATKIYPILLLLIPFVEKRYKYLIQTVIAGLSVTILPLFFFHGTVLENMIAFFKNLFLFSSQNGGAEYCNLYYTVGLTTILRLPVYLLGKTAQDYIMKIFFLIAVILVIITFAALKKQKVFWKKVLLVTSIMIFITPNSYLYNLCFLMVPIVLFLKENIDRIGDNKYVILLGLILIPKAYYYLRGYPEYISVQDIISPMLLFILIITLFIDCFTIAKSKNKV